MVVGEVGVKSNASKAGWGEGRGSQEGRKGHGDQKRGEKVRRGQGMRMVEREGTRRLWEEMRMEEQEDEEEGWEDEEEE